MLQPNTTLTSCPTAFASDNRYNFILGRCYFFLTSTKSFSDAQDNCNTIFGSGKIGQLYEPKSKEESMKIAVASHGIFGDKWAWIGVTDIITEGTFKYHSDNHPINYSPTWYAHYGTGGNSANCIIMNNKSSIGKWADKPCSEYRPSICEIK